MIAGITLSKLAERIENEQKFNRDFIVPSRALDIVADDQNIGIIFDAAGERWHTTPNGNAEKQLASALDIPYRYYERMRKDSPILLRDNVLHWLEKSDPSRLLRVRHGLELPPEGLSLSLDAAAGANIEYGMLRAVLSNRYRTIDNHDLIHIILPLLLKPGWSVKSCQVTDTRLYIQAVSTEVTSQVRVGDVVQAGVVISNSEVGAGALLIEPMVYTMACTNGMIVGSALRRNHVGRRNLGAGDLFEEASEFFADDTRKADDAALMLKVRDTVAASVNHVQFERLVDQLRHSCSIKIDKEASPQRVVEVTGKRYRLNEREQISLLTHFIRGDDHTAYGVMNAITRTAQDSGSYDRAIELERLGGEYIAEAHMVKFN